MLDSLFTGQEFLNSALDGLSSRSDAIAENLSNVDTPHYKAKEVAFEGQLQSILQKMDGQGGLDLKVTDPRHLTLGPSALSQFAPIAYRSTGTALRNDGNNVDIDSEMTELAETQISYDAVANLEKTDFSRLKNVINAQ